jgi:hypothetical protein
MYKFLDYLQTQINSIQNQKNLNENDYEIILVGPSSFEIDKIVNKNIIHIPFEDLSRNVWITKKKNIAVSAAKYENLVITHDYIGLCENWYSNFVNFGEDWDLCMNPIRTMDNKRFRDWVEWVDYTNSNSYWGPVFLQYEDNLKIKNMYISGTYWCAKKTFMLKNPLNENLMWEQGEDVEWSKRCQNYWNYKMNYKSVVRILKNKQDMHPNPILDPDRAMMLNSPQLQR